MRAGTALIARPLLTHGERKNKEIGNEIQPNAIETSRSIFAAVLLFLCGQFARAAENNSTIEGVVQDASGKPVAGAFVKLKNNDRHLEFMVISQAQGHYTVSNLPAGKYVIQGVGGGYQSNVSAPVDVAEGKTAKQDLSLTAKQGAMLPRAWPMKTPEALMVTVSKELPEGDGKKLIAARCTTCHDTERFIGFHMPREDGQFTIRRMRARMRTAKIRDLTPDEAKLAHRLSLLELRARRARWTSTIACPALCSKARRCTTAPSNTTSWTPWSARNRMTSPSIPTATDG